MSSIHGKDLIELLLESLHGYLHKVLCVHELLRGRVLGDQGVHGFLKIVHAPDELHGFTFALVEQRCDFCISGGFWVPLVYQNRGRFDALLDQ